jgi:hypothetical protein
VKVTRWPIRPLPKAFRKLLRRTPFIWRQKHFG